MNTRKGQAAMEFLMTYGWAIFVVLAAIGALAYFGILSPDKVLPDKCTTTPPFSCTQFKIQGAATDNVMLFLQNGGDDLQNINVDLTCDDGQLATPVTVFPIPLSRGDEINATFTCATAPVTGQRWKGNFTISYTVSGDQVSHSSTGSVTVHAE